MIERSRGEEDRRHVFLRVSLQGLALLAEIDKQDSGNHMVFLDNINDDDAQQVSAVLDKLRG